MMKEFWFGWGGLLIVGGIAAVTLFFSGYLREQVLSGKTKWQVEGSEGEGKEPVVIPSTEDLTPGPNPYLHAWLEVPSQVQPGKTVRFKFKVKNRGNKPIELGVDGDPPCDFVVLSLDNRQVWRYLYGKPIMESVALETLNSNEELVFEGSWNQRNQAGKPVLPGKYWVKGVLWTSPPAGSHNEQKVLHIYSIKDN